MTLIDSVAVTLCIVLIVIAAAGIEWSWRKHVRGDDHD